MHSISDWIQFDPVTGSPSAFLYCIVFKYLYSIYIYILLAT